MRVVLDAHKNTKIKTISSMYHLEITLKICLEFRLRASDFITTHVANYRIPRVQIHTRIFIIT